MGSDDDRRNTPTNKSAELHDLPEWAKSGWNTRFLRTLYHAINASESPLSEFKTDSASGLATINSIVKHAYPAMNHKVTKSDILFIMVRRAKTNPNIILIGFDRQSSEPMSINPRSFERRCMW
jgi:hypothetical protein